MGMLDKFLDVMRLNDDDDFYDDDYYDDDDYEEEKPKRKSIAKEKSSEPEDEPYEEKRPRPVKSQKVTPMRPSKRSNVSGMEVCVIKPTTVDDAREVTETLLLERPVVLAVNKADQTGRENPDIYEFYNLGLGDPIAVPPNVDISGDFDTIVDTYGGTIRSEF